MTTDICMVDSECSSSIKYKHTNRFNINIDEKDVNNIGFKTE